MDLRHDLGKYLRMPLRMLPEEASEAALREAVGLALRQTRRAASGVRSARELWGAAAPALRALAVASPRYLELEAAVSAALALEARLDAPEPFDRAEAEALLFEVGHRLDCWLAEVRS